LNIDAGVQDYNLSSLALDGLILAVEISTAASGTEFKRFDGYDIIPGDEDLNGKFRMTVNTASLQSYIVRITYSAPIANIAAATYAASQSETWVGPDRAIELPVLYAMAMVAGKKLDDRQDTLRYSTTQATNGVTDTDIMAASQLWLGEFERALEAFD